MYDTQFSQARPTVTYMTSLVTPSLFATLPKGMTVTSIIPISQYAEVLAHGLMISTLKEVLFFIDVIQNG